MSDDSERIQHTLKLIGYATLATLNLLDSCGLLAPDSPIKDIPLVLGLLIEALFAWPGGCDEEEFTWLKTAVAKVKEKGYVIAGAPYAVEKNVKVCEEMAVEGEDDIDEDEDEDKEIDSNDARPNWTTFDWKKEVRPTRPTQPPLPTLRHPFHTQGSIVTDLFLPSQFITFSRLYAKAGSSSTIGGKYYDLSKPVKAKAAGEEGDGSSEEDDNEDHLS